METKIFFPSKNLTVYAEEGANLLDIIQAQGLPIEAVCGGAGKCGKCLVSVDGEEKLACKTAVSGEAMTVAVLASAEGMEVLATSAATDAKPDAKAGGGSQPAAVAIAIDIGTTTVVVKATDAATGESLAVRGFTNPQRAFGADVLSRINLSMDDAGKLSPLITKALDEAIADVLQEAAIPAASIMRVVIAGNTTMCYLLLNLRCRSLGLAPFEPEFSLKPEYGYAEVFHTDRLACPVIVTPFLSAFVGGDIVSGLVHIGRHFANDQSYILVDMGTNGEIAYRGGGRLLATSTAAGPALEGGNILFGMSSTAGAIYAAEYLDEPGGGAFSVRTIGDAPPVGICGSGVIDLVAKLLAAGFIEATGAMSAGIPQHLFREVPLNDRPSKAILIAEGAGGADDVVFCQKDVREFQLAKGAIRAGIEILMKEMGAAPDVLYLAGAFGQNIDLDSAFAVGLLPESLRGRVQFVGNTSLGGAEDACLSAGTGGDIEAILAEAEEINLGSHPDFNNVFMETMMF
ncbi:MAG: ASKHA domain-containing protein [Clostridiales Family XIII bacterium]|jgi:uncharacterized 2Fe-2S/4Fe-4S cluster protein (DUF4445 family)|nr:ASKHA domain-containing protein [Clostridiales Family XIII bacterium]